MSENRIVELLGNSSKRVEDATTKAGGWKALMCAEPADHLAYGLTVVESTRIVAAHQLVMSWGHETLSRPRFREPDDLGRYLMPRYGCEPLESFGIVTLDSRNRLGRVVIVSTGSLNGSLVHPREVFRPAVVERACAIAVFHNHPSGDPTPSREDRELTKRLLNAGIVMGIQILDHVIVTASNYYSFKAHQDI